MDFLTFNLISISGAMILDFIFGDPYGFPHPVIFIGKLISKLEKLFRNKFTTNRELKLSGGILVIIIVSITFIIPLVILISVSFNKWMLLIVNTFLLYTTLAAKCLKGEGDKVYDALKAEDIVKSRIQVSYIVGRDTSNLNFKEIARATIETIAENASDGVIAPMFYGLIGGAPLAMVYKGINTMDSMVGYLTKEYKYIGFFPAKIDDLVNFIPARITGICMCLSSFIVGGNSICSFRIMLRDRKNHKSPNCAYPEGAAAGALRIQLGGTNVYFGEVIEKPTIGDKINEINMSHIKGCNRLMISAEILFFILWSLGIGVVLICQKL
ncbi:MAG: adenosylcobinamide-phosphate synthase CbiB [Clostridium sp.]